MRSFICFLAASLLVIAAGVDVEDRISLKAESTVNVR